MKYRVLNHTADLMIESSGKTVEDCFSNMAYAMFDQIVDAGKVEKKITRAVETDGDDDESMLYSFLSELLYIHDCEGLVFSGFDVEIDGNSVKCKAYGEPLDLEKHSPKAEIKAVTYHLLRVDRDVPSATVVFDV